MSGSGLLSAFSFGLLPFNSFLGSNKWAYLVKTLSNCSFSPINSPFSLVVILALSIWLPKSSTSLIPFSKNALLMALSKTESFNFYLKLHLNLVN